MPVIVSKGEPQSPFVEGMAKKELEKFNFIKYDMLGLLTLRLIRRTIELMIQDLIRIEVSTDSTNEVLYLNPEESVKLISGEIKLAKNITIDDEIDDEWLHNCQASLINNK